MVADTNTKALENKGYVFDRWEIDEWKVKNCELISA